MPSTFEILQELESQLLTEQDGPGYCAQPFTHGPGTGLAFGRQGAHAVFRNMDGETCALTVAPSMTDLKLYGWQLGIVRGRHQAQGTIEVRSHDSLSDIVEFLVKHFRVSHDSFAFAKNYRMGE